MNIKDNYLTPEEFDKIQTLIIGSEFPWFWNDRIVYEDDIDNFQFIHLFYLDFISQSPFIKILNPIIEKLNPMSLYRIKANLLTRTPNIVEYPFHVDQQQLPEEKQKQMTTSIFYVNTNNGYTKFLDGTIVESVKNRMITFPANTKHTGTSCTDEKRRVVINFNYFSNRKL